MALAHMKHRAVSSAFLLTTTLAASGPSSARAGNPLHFIWGIQQGCQRQTELERQVAKRLAKQHPDIWLLQDAKKQPLPPCSPTQAPRCARSLSSSCPSAQGRVLGAQITADLNSLNARMWLIDLETGQTAFLDETCQGCDLVAALAAQAERLIDAPRFGPVPGPQPTYCATPAGPLPLQACVPFEEPNCSDSERFLSSLPTVSAPQQSTSGPRIDPRTAKVITGLTWGAFAASAATAITLGIANPYVTRRNALGDEHTLTLAGPAWAVAGVSAGLLGINIPITLLVNRAQRPTSKTVESAAPSLIACPSQN